MDGGALVGNHDRSGVPNLIGNQVWVRTADAGEPAWTPPAEIRFWHQTGGGLYLSDGSEYHHVARAPIPAADVSDAVADLIGNSPTITAGAEAANARQVTVQLRDAQGNNLAERRVVRVWLADAQWGGECSAAPDGGVALNTGTLIQGITANKQYQWLSGSAARRARWSSP